MDDDKLRSDVVMPGTIKPPHPDQAVRLLRAKAAELENKVRIEADLGYATTWLAADIALVARLLADFMERFDEDVQTAKGMMDELHQSFREGRPDG